MILKAAGTPGGQCFGITASRTWIASLYGSGGSVAVLPMSYSQYTRDDDPPLVCAHGSALAELKFSPWNDNLLVTGGEDGIIKSFEIPFGGLTTSVSSPMVKVDVGAPVRCMAWHPTAQDVLAVGTKDGVRVVDLASGEVKYSFVVEGSSKDTMSVAWNADGSKLAILGKNSALHLFDPRIAPADQLEKFTNIESKKPQHVFFIHETIAVIAQNSMQKPYLAYYSQDLKELAKHNLDFSAGIVLPLFDPDTNLLFLTLRGATMLTVYDVSLHKGATSFNKSAVIVVDNGFKGACLIPKVACDLENSEIQRVIGLTSSGVDPVGIKVTRKAKGFCVELYPDTADVSPGMSPADYFVGNNAAPKKVSVQMNAHAPAPAPTPVVPAPTVPTPAVVPTISIEAATPSAAIAITPSHIKDSKAIVYDKSSVRAAIDKKLKGSLYRHVTGTEPRQQNDTWFKLSPKTGAYLSQNLQCNSKYWAMATKGGGGSVIMVQDINKTGRGLEKPPSLQGHKAPVICLRMSPVDPQLLVSAAQVHIAHSL
jgi:hypothetical protein